MHRDVHLGIAVDLDHQGLIVPVVRAAQGLRLVALSDEIAGAASRARAKRLTPDEVAGGTFTITNPGPSGTTISAAIIHQPQVAILSTDGVKRRPVVVELGDGGGRSSSTPSGCSASASTIGHSTARASAFPASRARHHRTPVEF